MHPRRLLCTLILAFLPASVPAAAEPPAAVAAAVAAVAELGRQVEAADYRADIPELHDLARRLEGFVADREAGPFAHYWRGFAYWRSASNTWNGDATNPRALTDLERAAEEFGAAAVEPALFADAKSARASALGARAFMGGNKADLPAALEEYLRLMKEAKAAQPDNPRLLWVAGMGLFYVPPPEGGADAAVAALTNALGAAKRDRALARPPAAPRWGEAEIEMAIAWVQANRPDPKLQEADVHAHAALALVPSWHYLKAFLLPQIHAKLGGGEAASCPLTAQAPEPKH